MILYVMSCQEQVNNQRIKILKQLFLINKTKPQLIVGKRLNGLSQYEVKVKIIQLKIEFKLLNYHLLVYNY